MKPTNKTKGVAQLTEEQEEFRLNVVDLELKARYWKAQHDIRYYTLGWSHLESEYMGLMTAHEKVTQELKDKIQSNLKDLNEQPGISVEESDPDKTTVYDEGAGVREEAPAIN